MPAASWKRGRCSTCSRVPAMPPRAAWADKDKPWVAKLVKAYQSEEIRRFILDAFKGSVVPGF